MVQWVLQWVVAGFSSGWLHCYSTVVAATVKGKLNREEGWRWRGGGEEGGIAAG